jgi:(p)ppGpp synthase/HD superfamily hydrolase
MKRSTQLFDAIEFATKAHRGQFRKGTNIPYIVHPLSVCRTLIEYGAKPSVATAGVLHDTVEDTNVTVAQIRKKFGSTIARLVEAASEPDKSLDWETRKKHTIRFLLQAPSKDILLLSCADKLDNIRAIRTDYDTMGEELWKRFNRPKEQQSWYYRELAETFMQRVADAQTEKLFRSFSTEVDHVFGE